MIRTSKYRRTGKFAGVCHSRIGFWAGPGQFVGELIRFHGLCFIFEQLSLLIVLQFWHLITVFCFKMENESLMLGAFIDQTEDYTFSIQ